MKKLKYFISSIFLILILEIGCTTATTQANDNIWVGDFEHGPMELTRANPQSVWYEQGNLAEVVSAPAPVRRGMYAVKFFVDRINSPNSHRSMIIPKGNKPKEWAVIQDVGKDWWYGFSVYFPKSWAKDNIWDLVAQIHGRPDLDIGEDYRNPILAWYTDGDNIIIKNKWDAKRNTFESGTRVYGGQRTLWTGSIQKEQWTDWVMHAKWSYQEDGIVEIWRNGVKVVNSRGPNCFNDKKGPYFDIGIYKGWRDRSNPPGTVGTRLVYFDEVRIADENASYSDVAPR